MEQFVEFIKEVERLKSVKRTAWTATGRRESTAEHSWRLALMAALFLDADPELDKAKVLEMCLFHDLGELYDGDISAALLPDPAIKHEKEYQSVKKACSKLPDLQGQRYINLWLEYEAGETAEAQLVKALDKAETIIQHNQGANPETFDFTFNLSYGRQYFQGHDRLTRLRKFIDQDTMRHIHNRKK